MNVAELTITDCLYDIAAILGGCDEVDGIEIVDASADESGLEVTFADPTGAQRIFTYANGIGTLGDVEE